MKMEYRRHLDNGAAPWQLVTNIDELMWNGEYFIRVSNDNGSSKLPFPMSNDETATLVVKDYSHEGKLQRNRKIVQEISKVEQEGGKVLNYTRVYHEIYGTNRWGSWEQETNREGTSSGDNKEENKIQWTSSSYLDTYTTAGIYDITGERTNDADGLPLANAAPGHTFHARLLVLDSSIAGSGKDTDKCITQILSLSNRTGGDGNVYTRTGRAASKNLLAGGSGWGPWGKLQQNVEVGQVTSLDSFTDNGIYSGVYTNGSSFFETFVMVVINNYAVAAKTGNIRSISQYKHALNIDGTFSQMVRTGQGNTGISWGAWTDFSAAGIQDGAITAQKLSNELNELINKSANGAYWTYSPNTVTLNINNNDGTVESQFLPAATSSAAGVMSADDKKELEKLVTIDYADNSYTAGKWVEENGCIVAASSSSYAKYSPIPVCGGQKIVYSAASGSDNIPLYITDKDGVVIYSTSRMNGEIYAPSEAAFIYITSTKAAYSCVVYGVYDTYSYRAQKLDKLLGEDIALPLNGYYTATGAWQASDGWYCTNKIAVSENSGIETNATYIACWDINNSWLGRNSGKGGMLEGTKYIAVYSQNINITLRFNSDYCNIPTQEDMHSLSRSIESLAGGIKGIVDIDAEMSDSIALANNNVTVIEGVAGEAGARYSVPIAVKGNYGITIKFRMPDDLHTSVYERELASFGTRASSSTNGFSVEIKSVLPTNDLSQISCKSTLGFYPTNSKTNNYAGSLSVGSTNRPFVGEAAFSIRYTGSLEGNADIAYTLGEEALRVYHTDTDADVLNIPYPEDGLITSLLDAINAHTSTLEAVGYAAENLTLDNIIKCSAIPLVYDYSGTVDAFPSYVLLKDDDWHTLEVRFNAGKGKGDDMIAGYIDGQRFYHVDNGFKLYGDGFFKSDLIFGCEGVVVKSLKVEPVLKSEIPNIVALCQHSINGDEKFNSTVTSSTNLSVTYGRTEELLRVFKKYGFKYVTNEQINGYLRRGEVLPHNCFTIIHDDYHYLRENAEKEYARDIRKLYLRNGIKVAFGLIPGYLTDEEIAEVEKDKDVFEFLIHDDYSLSSSKGYQAIANRIANNISNFKSKLYTSNIWIYIGGVFDANTKMMLHAAGISMAYYTSGTTTSGGISPMKDMMVLPRLYMNDTSPNTISILEDILSNLVKH